MFQYVTTNKALIQAVSELVQYDVLALDTETSVEAQHANYGSALDVHTSEISLLILKGETSAPYVFDLAFLREVNYDRALIRDLLANVKLIGANLRFDLKFLFKEYGVWYRKLYDVVIGSKLIGNATGSKVARQLGHGYGDICRELLNVHIDGKNTLRKSSWAVPLASRRLEDHYWNEKVTYAANDVQYLFPIKAIQLKTLTTPLPHTTLTQTNNQNDEWGLGMADVVEREMALVTVVAKMEYNGMPASHTMMGTFQGSILDELNSVAGYLSVELKLDHPIKTPNGLIATPKVLSKLRSAQELLKLINRGLNLQKFDSTQAEGLKRAVEILDLLATMEDKDEAEKADVFVNLDEAELYSELIELENSALLQITPVVQAILKFKKLTKQDGMDLRKYINPVTGRIHASYDQLGAATGRYGCIAEGQRIMVPGGWKKIEDIQVGDYVYCYDNNNRPAVRRVVRTFFNGVKKVVSVKWTNQAKNRHGALTCTHDHELFTPSEGWVKAENLKDGQKIFHLYRETKERPYLYGANCFKDREQTVIKKSFFKEKYVLEHAHYKDGDKVNNNFEILTKSEHHSLHNKGKLQNYFYSKCSLKKLVKENNSSWLNISRYQLIKMIAKARGRLTYLDIDFNTFKKNCELYKIDYKGLCQRYSSTGVYLSRSNVKKALYIGGNVTEASKLLGIGTRKLRRLCVDFDAVYTNHIVLEVIQIPEEKPVYNLEVEEFHNYIAEELNVKNCSNPNLQQQSGRTTCKVRIKKKDIFT